MDLLWKPEVISAARVDIPEVTVNYDAAALTRWNAAIDPFIRSERKRYFVFREYAELARGGRFILPFAREVAKKDSMNFTLRCCCIAQASSAGVA